LLGLPRQSEKLPHAIAALIPITWLALETLEMRVWNELFRIQQQLTD